MLHYASIMLYALLPLLCQHNRCKPTQDMQKAQHDTKAKETRYMIGENVMAKNYQNGCKWVPGVIVEQLETLTFLVQLA